MSEPARKIQEVNAKAFIQVAEAADNLTRAMLGLAHAHEAWVYVPEKRKEPPHPEGRGG